MTEQQAVTIAEAARRLGISSEAVRMRIKRRTLEAHRVGNSRSWLVYLETPTECDPTAVGAVQTTNQSLGSTLDLADLRAERDQLADLVAGLRVELATAKAVADANSAKAVASAAEAARLDAHLRRALDALASPKPSPSVLATLIEWFRHRNA